MFDRLIDLVAALWDRLVPVFLIYEYERALRFRLGRVHSALKPGLHFKIPFADKIHKLYRILDMAAIGPQSLTTRDGKAIVIGVIVAYHVGDARKYFMNAKGPEDAMSDAASGVISALVLKSSWSDLQDVDNVKAVIHEGTQERASKFGIVVDDVMLSDLIQCRSFRLWQTSTTADATPDWNVEDE